MMIDAVSKVNFNSLRFMYESRSQIFMSIVSHPFNVHSHKRKFICDSVVSHQFNVHSYKRKFLCDKVVSQISQSQTYLFCDKLVKDYVRTYVKNKSWLKSQNKICIADHYLH